MLALAVVLGAALSVSAYEVASVPDGGALTGVVKLAGVPPRLEPLKVTRAPEACGDERPSEALVLGTSRTVQGSVVLLEGVTRGKKERGDVVLDTQRCAFVSHVSAAMFGDRVRVKNSDTTVHNPHGFLGKSRVFSVAVPGKDQMIDITKRLTRPGVVRVLCGVHPHMQGWIVLHDSPYFAVTDEGGAFRIDGIPPGTYKVTMWHEGFRAKGVDRDGRPAYGEPKTVTKEVTIGARAQAAIDFELR